MGGATAAHHLHTAGADNALPQRLIEVDRLDAGQGNLCHLDIEDAVLLHKACVRDSKLATSADDAPYNPCKEGQHQQCNTRVEKSCLLIWKLVVCQPDGNNAAYSKQE